MAEETPPDPVGAPEIDPSEVNLEQRIGSGTFGVVYRATCRGQPVAVKIPRRQELSEKQLASFRREVAVLKRCWHPNIVLFLGACSRPGSFFLVTDLLLGDIESLLRAPDSALSPSLKHSFAKDTALAMNWLHGISHMIHRDLKPANLLYDAAMRVKVTDFGFSQLRVDNVQFRDQKGPKGSALWMAPEVLLRQPFDEKIDVYAFGLILWELQTQEVLFPQYDDFGPFSDAVAKRGERPPISTRLEAQQPSLVALMQDCWRADPATRPSFGEVLPRLDQVQLEMTVSDVAARQFWMRRFANEDGTIQEAASWRDFASALVSETSCDPSALVDLESLFTVHERRDGAPTVTLAHFNQLVLWFGRFFDGEAARAALQLARSLLDEAWFHGAIDRPDAERRLLNRPENTFLMRLSTSKDDHPFTMSVLRQSTLGLVPQHKRVRHVHGSGQYFFPVAGGTRCFSSLFDLVLSPDCGFVFPCPRESVDSPYVTSYSEF